jgi:acetoin utilization protein AcuC
MTKNLQIAYSDDYLNWQLGSGDGNHITKPIRAKLATEYLVEELGDSVDIIEPRVMHGDREKLESIHHPSYVAQVLDAYTASDWYGMNQDNAETAFKMFAGTVRLTENIISGETNVGFNPQGAKHHAKYTHSEGFCVFNDMVWAAREFKKAGHRPLYLDWDVHAGNGVQNLLELDDIPTLSIHGSGIYPYGDNNHSMKNGKLGTTHTWHDPDKHFYNWNIALPGYDYDLYHAFDGVQEVIEKYEPTVFLLAAGADGHEKDLWGMKYSLDGFAWVSDRLSRLVSKYADGKILIGGAGGYRPYDWTPKVWKEVVSTIYTSVR